MFKHLLIYDSTTLATVIAFITASSIFCTISYRAIRMKKSEIEKFENLPFETDRNPVSHDTHTY